jgi:IS5 family transposase
MRGQAGFWEIDERYVRLSEAGDPLEKLNAVVCWEVFAKPLAKALKRSDGAKGGRPAYDPVLMFKVMVLQALYSLSDDQAEFQIQDRLSFMRFLGLGLGDKVPDAKTIWLFREHLTQARAVDNLFARFDRHLTKAGYLAMGGQIVDATIVAAPKQRNTDAEKAAIKAGKIPDEWKHKPAKLRQKDRDARWTVKFSKARVDEDGKIRQRDIAVPAFGYNIWPAPSARGKFKTAFGVCINISGLGICPGQDGYPRLPVPKRASASRAVCSRGLTEGRSTVMPSIRHPLTDIGNGRWSPPAHLVAQALTRAS